mgnify:CR=1 FL=1
MKKRGWLQVWLVLGIGLGIILSSCVTNAQPGTLVNFRQMQTAESFLLPETEAAAEDGVSEWGTAIAAANTATELAQRAFTAADWDQAAYHWSQAIQALQSIAPESPQRLFTQRKLQEYLQHLRVAQQQAQRASARRVMPSLGSPILDEQLALYRSYVATMGVPEVLIVGSSRALQGLDPQVLQRQLAEQGRGTLRVYNLGVNGATAQLVGFLLRQLLSPEELPQMVLWPGGSRSFNSARLDRTFATLLDSSGYRSLDGDGEAELSVSPKAVEPQLPLSDINAYGFLPRSEQFDPEVYYQNFPRVGGLYDNDYQPFGLEGVQAISLEATVNFLRSQQIPLVFINLPLSNDYLDTVRLNYERQFQQFLQQEAGEGFEVIDWLERWQGRNQYFADPSHLNKFGAAALANQLATMPLPWPTGQQEP